jgi:D-lyxose ketol-isomerase
MKRSEINQHMEGAIHFFESQNFMLPPWAYWTLEQWKEHGGNHDEIIENHLGWDLTDFGSGNFKECGLLLFTLRNGTRNVDQKLYAEKIMIVGEDQRTPMHFHWSKMEDIINRGGGNLMIQLFPSNEREEFAEHEFEVSLDGIRRRLQPGQVVKLQPGESITLYQGLYHSFSGESGQGKVLVGEVSTVNDDQSDNRFFDELGRFPEIEEDEPLRHLLVGDYHQI